MPAAQTKEVIERELNAPLDEVFEWIDLEKPLGSASISQVPSTHASLTPCTFHHDVQVQQHLGRRSRDKPLCFLVEPGDCFHHDNGTYAICESMVL